MRASFYPLDTIIEILGDPYVDHEKEMYRYVSPQVETVDEIETKTALVDDKIIDIKTKYDEINDVATEQKKPQKITDLIDDVIDKSNPFQNLRTEDIWIEDDIFDKNDSKKTIEISKDILKDINKNDPFLDFNVITEEIISELFDDVDFTENEVRIEDVQTTKQLVMVF